MTDEQMRTLWTAAREEGFESWLKFSKPILAAGASEGQAEPVGWAVREKHFPHRLLFSDETGEKPSQADREWAAKQGHEYVPLYTHPSAELTALRERIAGMEKNAERYRWLKMRSSVGEQRQIMSTPWGQWDAFADAAIAKQDAKESPPCE